ncbi:MAG: Ig-like domain-containing protein [Gammaproteobacteria bacterium]|nr:Ig-like domain-containing protein [Gammaproteobacteria bacterium]
MKGPINTESGALTPGAAVADSAGGAPVRLVDDAPLLLQGEYLRQGADLVLRQPGGREHVLQDYFKAAAPADLVSPGGPKVHGATVLALAGPAPEPVQVAGLLDSIRARFSAEPDAARIGTVRNLGGVVTARGADGELRLLKHGDAVFEGDVLETKSGFVSIRFQDGTFFQLGANARAVLDEFTYQPEASEGSFASTVLIGAFRYVSGKLAELQTGRHSTIKTPVATIGIRGSELDGEVESDGTTHILHSSGILEVQDVNGTGIVSLIRTDTATTVAPGDAPIPVYQAPPAMKADFQNKLPPRPTPQEQEQEDPAEQQAQDAGGFNEFAPGAPDADDDDGDDGPGGEDTAADGGADGGQDDGGDPPPPPPEDALAPGTEPQTVLLNAPPTPADDTASTSEDASVTLNVLANDTDPDGDGIAVVSANLQSLSGSTITLTPDGTLTFDPRTSDLYQQLRQGKSLTEGINYTVTDARGGTATATAFITVTGVNDAPVAADDAVATDENTVLGGNLLADNGNGADSDPDAGDTLTISAVDGSGAAVGSPITLASGALLTVNPDGTFAYDPNDQFGALNGGETATDTFGYTVSDGNGATDTASVTVTVTAANDGPTAQDDLATTNEDTVLTTANVLANDTDPDASDVLFVSALDTTATQGLVTSNGDGTFNYDPNGQFESLAAGETTTDTFGYTVSDGNGGTDTATVTVTVTGVNDAPVAADDAVATDENTVLGGNLLADNGNGADSDPDVGDTLTISAVDGSGAAVGSPITLASGALLTVNPDGTFAYDPNGQFESLAAGETATDTFGYTVSDGNGATDTATVTLTVTGVNDGPTAQDDLATTDEDTVLTTANVLANDTDPDASDVLFVSALDTTATQGLVTSNGDGTFNYDPNGQFESLAAGETSTDTFGYTVSDGNGGTDTATVTVTVTGVNDAPVAADDAVATDENTVLGGNLLADNGNGADSDPDVGDTLTISAVDGSGAAVGSPITLASGALLTVNSDGTFAYDPNGQFESLAAGETATDTFGYTVSDGNGATDTDTATVTVTVTGVNDGPTAQDDLATTDEDTVLTTANVLANDTDGDLLFVSALDTTATQGLVTSNGDGTFNYDSNGQFESLAAGETSTDTFGYTVSDGNGGTDTATVTVTVTGVNDAPVAADDAVATDENTVLGGNLLADNGNGADSDPDVGDTLTISAVDGSGAAVGSPITLASGALLTVNPDGTFAYDPNGQFESLAAGETATDTFGYTVSDGNGATDTATVTLTVTGVNDGPTAQDDLATTDEDTVLTTANVLANDTDPDASDVLFVSALDTTATQGLVTSNGDGTFNYDPNGQFESLAAGETSTDTFGYTVSDGNGGTDTATVTVTVTGVNDAPVAADDAVATDENTVLGGNLLADNGNGADSDPDVGDTLTISAVDGSGAAVGSPITLASGALLTVNPDGTFAYDPNGQFESLAAGETATDTFGYTVSDGNGATDTGTVTVTLSGIDDAGPAGVFDLASLLGANGGDGSAGFVVNGIDTSDFSGISVAGAGDINGDGIDDLIIGASGADPNGTSDAGESYVVFGRAGGFGASIDLGALEGSDGFVLTGIDFDDRSGYSVAGAGDVNGDGIDDLLIGAYRADPNGTSDAGESYVVFGRAGGFGASVDLGALEGSDGFVLTGIDSFDNSGVSVAGAGDINGDGIAELLIGAYYADPNGNSNAGESYVVFGRAGGFGASVDLGALEGSDGFVLTGIDGDDYSGRSVAGAGDVNGDGIADLLIGAWRADPNGNSSAGESYVVFGRAGGFGAGVDVGALDGSDGFVLTGIDFDDRSGYSVAGAGDVNGDGIDDLIIGARGADPNDNSNAGESYVVFGRAGGFGASVDLGALDGSDGFVLNGIGGGDFSGRSVAGVGDVNGDGIADLLIGAFGADPNGNSNAGESYVVFGRAGGFGASVDLAALGSDGFVLTGIDGGDFSGRSVAGAGDVNGDGIDDLLVGANLADPNDNTDAGESYVVFGRPTAGAAAVEGTDLADAPLDGTGAGEYLLGLVGDDILNGLDGDDHLIGGAGDDFLDGGPGADTAAGGPGNDTIVYDALDTRVVGGGGDDTVTTGPAGSNLTIDLTTGRGDPGASHYSEYRDIEIFDIRTNADNTLVLDATALFAVTDARNTLRVRGDAADTVQTTDSGWVDEGTEVVDAVTYQRFTQGQAVLLVEQGMTLAGGLTPEVFDLGSLLAANGGDGSAGFVLNGIDGGDRSGYSVAGAGDVNGDGIDDLIIGAFRADPNGTSDAGESYVVFGHAGGFAASVDLGALDGSDGFVLTGIDLNDYSGRSVSGAGDVNGDGIDDLLIGAHYADPNGNSTAGESYVVFGRAGGFGTSINLGALDGSDGFVLTGIDSFDRSGVSVAGAGDVNGDGIADLLIGAYLADPNGNSNAGESYVVFGRVGGFGDSVDLGALDGSDGFVLTGIDSGDGAGSSVSRAGDVNGDGIDDLLIGADGADPNGNNQAGESYVVFGRAGGFGASVDLGALDGSDGFVLTGIDSLDFSGRAVAGTGDVNGDGIDDLLIGAQDADPNGTGSAGESYVVFGRAGGFGASLDLGTLDGSDGFVLTGIGSGDRSGVSVAGAGDVNGDGIHDLLIGAFGADPDGNSAAGESYVVFGRAGGFGASMDLGALTGSNGFVLTGIAANDFSGNSVAGAGDVNGDGIDDLLIGAYGADPNGNDLAGESYVVFGRPTAGAAVVEGSAGADTVTGTGAGEYLLGLAGDDILNGLDGDDHLIGGAGDDVLDGGPGADTAAGGLGNDTIVYDALDTRVVGGGGVDTLRVAGAGELIDFSGMGRLNTESVERIDLTGTGDNTLALSFARVFDLAQDFNLFTADDTRQVVVDGDEGDSVNLFADDPADVSAGAAVDIGGTQYTPYTHAGLAATVFMADELAVDTQVLVG